VTKSIALATCAEWAGLTEDDGLLVRALAERGVSTEPALWDAPRDWSRHAAVVLRSPWDYFHRLAEFEAWLSGLVAAGVPCLNPVPLVRWNLDKRYLEDLAAEGVAIVPTLRVPRGSSPDLEDLRERLAARGWTDLIAKPSVSGGAWRTERFGLADLPGHAGLVEEILADSDLLLQPFLSEIEREGEWSFVYFEGRFSHAVLKRPRTGDHRVQWRHGGTHARAEPPSSLLAEAARVLAAAPAPGVYARVDGVVHEGRFLLMELEQVEPFLFFAEAPGSAECCADAVLRALGEPEPQPPARA
jgi:hypothetical protein